MIVIPFATYRPRLVYVLRCGVIDVMDPLPQLRQQAPRIGDTVYDAGGQAYAIVTGLCSTRPGVQLQLI